ncbi:MAG: hypothetical protein IBJ13_13300 [Sphingopyxis sp.]|nr:hypothetical protein [Sphingopyxis sp.]
MKYKILAAALAFAAVPASAMTIDADERELYDNSIQCMAFFGIMAGLGGDGPEDPKMVESGTKFLAVATVLADEDKAQIQKDFDAEMKNFARLAQNADNPDAIAKVKQIGEDCQFLETLVDAMVDGSS